jgi:hypothetical protein
MMPSNPREGIFRPNKRRKHDCVEGSFKTAGGGWNEVEPEVINWKTGGVLKSIVRDGLVKGDLNGTVKGPKSPNKAPANNEILVVAYEGVSITEYQLLKLRPHGESREFRMA